MNPTDPDSIATEGTQTDPEFVKAQHGYEALLGGFQSIQLGTTTPDGVPEVSYAPSILDERRHFYVHVSELASHTSNLIETGKASVMIIEDEGTCENLFARKRVTFTCNATPIERHSESWEHIILTFEAKFGKMIAFLKTMEDFHLFRLEPSFARLVLGFGQAYDINEPLMDKITHIAGKGVAHRKESPTEED